MIRRPPISTLLPYTTLVRSWSFMGGSMGSVVGEKVARSAERAAEAGMPLLTINASGGARMHEGILSLMQMAKASVRSEEHTPELPSRQCLVCRLLLETKTTR